MLGNRQLRQASLWFAVAIGMAVGAVSADEPRKAEWLSPPELMKLAEDSEKSYLLQTTAELADIRVEEFAERFWPSIGGGVPNPWIVEATDGGRSLKEYDLGAGCESVLVEAEPLFEAKRYSEALPLYIRATKQHPECYVAFSHVADCHHFQGDYRKALKWYNKSIELNPFDFLGHYYKGNALSKLKRFDEAREAYVMALALRPHRESVVQVLQILADELGVRVTDRPFLPLAFARQKGDQIEVTFDPDKPHWLAYGLCKGVWIGEPELREEQSGETEHVWSLREEKQCIMSMVEHYYAQREDESVELDPDPEMERLLTVLDDGLIDAFIVYEIAYRLSPHTTLLLPKDVFGEVVDYVGLHIVTDVAE